MTDDTQQWQQTPPTQLGWFWLYRKADRQPKLVQVFADTHPGTGKPVLRYSFHETPMSSHALTKDTVGQWFGPVQDPPRKPE